MIIQLTLALATATAGADSLPVSPPAVRDLPVGVTWRAMPDTVPARPRRKAIELSEAYATRLTIHKWASYATLPLFAAQAVVGQRLFSDAQNGRRHPEGLIDTHETIAFSLGALFVVNTVTGGLNWWETRHNPAGRTWRTAHALLMLAADAGFAATAAMADDDGFSQSDRTRHRSWAIGSASIALVSYAMMWSPIRQGR